MIDWGEIEAVMLDMDGTLLDLHFDNYFWQEYLPEYWGKRHGLGIDVSKALLSPRFESVDGTLAWYCLDYWSEQLDIDILSLKHDLGYLIKTRPYVELLLEQLVKMNKLVLLVTNAHQNILDMKLEKTGIKKYFDHIISSHTLGHPKENLAFWHSLSVTVKFDCEKTLLIDDNSTVLGTAKNYGIRYLLGIDQPDSQLPVCASTEFTHISDFREIFLP